MSPKPEIKKPNPRRDSRGNKRLPKGEIILCPRKKHRIGVLTRSLEPGDMLNVSKIVFEPGQERAAGEYSACKICGSMYFTQGKLYTQDGWHPNEPTLEPVTKRN